MIFWVSAAALALLTMLAFLWPLLRRNEGAMDRADGAIAIFRDQLGEVDRDAERGIISGLEAEAARTEIKRRMIAADKGRGPVDSGGLSGRKLLIACALLTPLAGAALYTQLGAPTVPSIPFAERAAELTEAQNLDKLTTQLRTKLESEPDGGETRGWELLATTYGNMGRYGDAAYAYSRIVERDGATSATWSQYAEALISAENGTVTKTAEEAIARSIALDPLNPAGTYYNAVAMGQAGQTEQARQSLLDRLALETAPAPWMPFYLREINRLGDLLGLEPATLPDFPDAPRGPSAADVDAASEMSAEDRQEFVRTMVGNLAERMKDEPDNLQGWLQLARAYGVLGEDDNARAAYESAKALTDKLPEDDPRRVTVEQGLAALGN
ncbi:cytochrome c-type biogenesis protein CcmH [Litoreibacter ascidiaceicola]|uniref:Cytochrome c-type biogenesis protein CcmH n=1 Tax=Litoreibacter ascidiaceicola TaxID=1486859 RepID=A0A1M4V6B6_9RHOB|nr:c-type cytochrome biogenesis protein CcmI [Litoreibacter ascidiaceicola]SHE64489.1 cytochrome c-type biogenesis protein CcmH [Litoreibacter ascidiaceicola]